MTAPESCPRTDQAVAWALHVLEPDEEAEVRGHLPDCAECRAVVRETEETMAALGGALTPEEPPAGLRTRILDETARTPQEPRAATGVVTDQGAPRRQASAGPSGGAGSGPGRGDATGRRAGRRERRRGGLRGRVVAAAAAALVALGAIAGLGVYSAQVTSERNAEAARAESLLAMVQQMATPGTAHAFLAPAQGGPAVAAVLATPAGQQMVVPVGLPTNPDDHVYVLWGLPGEGSPTPLGTFDVGDDGAGVESVGSSPDGTGFAHFAISIEPGRAAPASPSDVVASGRAEI